MKSNSLVFLGLAVVLLIAPRRPPARHGLAAYDMTKVIVKGTVTEFAFINPHAAIHLDVKDDKGNTKDGSLKPTVRTIWPRNSIKPEDQIAVVGNRAKDGSKV